MDTRATITAADFVWPTDGYERVTGAFNFPFEGRWFQVEDINYLAPRPRTGLYAQPGLGKTYTSTVCALHHMMNGAEVTLVVVPPILITGWNKWLSKVTHKDGCPLKVLMYRGTPTQRKQMSFHGYDFVIMSMDIFKRDQMHINVQLAGVTSHVILDEATCIKCVSTGNYKTFRDFTLDKTFQLLTGTPLNKVEDGYAYIKLISPEIYKTMHQFASIHIEEVDFFGKPKKYANLDLLQQNLLHNSARRIKEEVLDLKLPNIIPMHYDLDPAHKALYTQIAEEQLLRFEDGMKLDMTNVSALWNALQQVVLNWGYFAQDEDRVAAGFDLIQEVLDEIGDAKLMVFANYRMSNRALGERFKHVGAVGIWGDIPAKQKDANWKRFLEDPTCQLIHLQPSSGGLGLDGGQAVCADILYIECPLTPLLYEQSMSRLYRDGQEKVVNVRIAVAEGTLQSRSLTQLTERQDLVMSIQGGVADLRAAIFGN